MKLSSRAKLVLCMAAAAAGGAAAVLAVTGLAQPPWRSGAPPQDRGAPTSEAQVNVREEPVSAPAVPPADTPPEQVRALVETPDISPPEQDAAIENEAFTSLDLVILRNCYPPKGESIVTVEYFRGGGLSVTVRTPAVISVKAEYGMPMAKHAVRLCGLDSRQLSRIRQFERRFRFTADARMAKMYKSVEITAAEIANAVDNELWGDCRRRLEKLDRQMSDIREQWRLLYREYVGGIEPILTQEQRVLVRAAVLGEGIDVP